MRASFTALLFVVLAGQAFALPGTLRVYETKEDSFDYALRSYSTGAGGEHVLSINHRNGRTYFVKVGQKVDNYTVVSFVPRTETVFNPTVNTHQTKKAGRAVLEGPGGEVVSLELGKLRKVPGMRATIVATDTGQKWGVRNDDTIMHAGEKIHIDVVAQGSVVASSAGDTGRIPLASAEEKSQVATLWNQQRAEKRERVMLAQKQQRRVTGGQIIQAGGGGANMAAGHVVGVPGSESEFFFGTEYRYPTEYQVWFVKQGPNNEYKPVVIPTKFDTRMVGTKWGPDGFTRTSVSAYPGRNYIPRNASPMVPHPKQGSYITVPYPQHRFKRFEYRKGPLH